MAIKIQTIDESIQDVGIKMLVYGLLGSGKTRLCATAARDDSPVLIVNAEAGMLSLRDIPDEQKKNIQVAEVSTMGDLDELYSYLSQEHRFNWVCIDSISEVAEVVLANEKSNTADGRAAYGNLADIMMKMLRAYRDIPNYNVCMSAKMTRFTDEITNRTMYWPLMPGKTLTNGIGYLFDEVFALRVESDKENNTYRVLQTSRDIQYEAKDRSGRLAMWELADLSHIEAKIHGNIPVIENEEVNENGTSAE